MEKKDISDAFSSGADAASDRISLNGQIEAAYDTLLKIVDRILFPQLLPIAEYVQDGGIPAKVIKDAMGVAIMTVIKGGFIFSGTVGTGIVLVKTNEGKWSGPVSIGCGGMGWGLQIGASKTDSFIILRDEKAVEAFSGKAQVRLGANVSVAAGPVGRDVSGDVGVSEQGQACSCFSYSHCQGIFAGLSFQGAVISVRHDDNKQFYERSITAKEILSGSVVVPKNKSLEKIYKILDQLTQGEEISTVEFKKLQAQRKQKKPRENIYGKSLEQRIEEEIKIADLPPAEKATARQQYRVQRMVAVEELFDKESDERRKSKRVRHEKIQNLKRYKAPKVI